MSERTWTLIFQMENQVDVFRAEGSTPSEAAGYVRSENGYLKSFRCIAALPGTPAIFTAPSHACIGEDIFE